jgi:hypothetical protein
MVSAKDDAALPQPRQTRHDLRRHVIRTKSVDDDHELRVRCCHLRSRPDAERKQKRPDQQRPVHDH